MKNSELKTRTILIVVARLALAAVFFAAAWPKILDPGGFSTDIENYSLIPKVLVNLMALTLPWLELMIALGLILGHWTSENLARGAALLALVLLGVFILALTSAVVRNLDISCGCFGHSGGRKAGFKTLTEDGGFLFLAALSILPLSSGPRKRKRR